MFCELIKKHFVKIHLLFLIGVVILFYWQTFAYWVHTWINNIDYKFNFLIPILTSFILWKKRDTILSSAIKPSNYGIFIIIIGILFYIFGQVAFISVAKQISFFIMLPGIVLFYFGFPTLRKLVIPFFVLVFMAPLPEFIFPYLQDYFAWITVEILHLLNYPVLREGNIIYLPESTVSIIAGCTGIRSFSSIFPLGLTIAFVYFLSRGKKILMMIFSSVLPVIANHIRILTLLLLSINGNVYFMKGSPHQLYGYIVYLVTVIILILFAIYLYNFKVKNHSQINFQNKNVKIKRLKYFFSYGFNSYQKFILVSLILIMPILIHYRLFNQPCTPLKKSFDSFPLDLGKWKGSKIMESDWKVEVIGASDNLKYQFIDPKGNIIRIFVTYMPIQRQGRELVFHSNKIIPKEFVSAKRQLALWEIKSNSYSYVLKTTCLVNKSQLQDEKLLYWYKNTDRYLHSKFMSKLYMVYDNLFKNRSDGSVFVLVSKNLSNNKKEQEEILHNFLNLFMFEISKYLPF